MKKTDGFGRPQFWTDLMRTLKRLRVVVLLVDHGYSRPCCKIHIIIGPLQTWNTSISIETVGIYMHSYSTFLSEEGFARLLAHHDGYKKRSLELSPSATKQYFELCSVIAARFVLVSFTRGRSGNRRRSRGLRIQRFYQFRRCSPPQHIFLERPANST